MVIERLDGFAGIDGGLAAGDLEGLGGENENAFCIY